MSQLVINTKYSPPPHRSLISRGSLNKQLNSEHLKLMLVSAPAGFGKSSYVVSALEEYGFTYSWLSLSHDEAAPIRFISGLVTSITKILPDALCGSSELLKTANPNLDVIAEVLLQELQEIKQMLFVVLDDYHRLESESIDELMEYFLELGPPNIRWVLITREDPSLSLSKMRVSGELAEVRAHDLRFGIEDTKILFHQYGVTLSEQDISVLDSKVEGWAAGIQLCALSIRSASNKAEFISDFKGSQRFIVDYLVEEVLSQQSYAVQDFLLRTSIFERFNPDMCDAVLSPQVNARQIIHQIQKLNLFLVALDNNDYWFRYHHLFAEVLQQHQTNSRLDNEDVLEKASQWLFDNKFPLEAIDYAIQANRSELAADFIARTWPSLRKTEPESIFLEWISRLPEDTIANCPSISIYYTLALLSHQPVEAKKWIDMSEKCLLVNPGDNSLSGLLEICKAYREGSEGNIEGVFQHCDAALTTLPESELTWRAAASILKGLLLLSSGEIAHACNAFAFGQDQMLRDGEVSGAISTIFLLANARIMQGQVDEASRLCKRALTIGSPYSLAPQGCGDIYTTLATIEIRRANYQQADLYLQSSRDLGTQASLRESAHRWYVLKAIIAARAERKGDALDLLDEAAHIYLPSPSPEFEPIDAHRARIELNAGDFSSARSWMSGIDLTIDDQPHTLIAFSLLTIAYIEIESLFRDEPEADLSRVLRFLDRLWKVEEHSRPAYLPEIAMLKALALLRSDESAALEQLKYAMHLPHAEANAAFFFHEHPRSKEWLSDIQPNHELPSWLIRHIAPEIDKQAYGEDKKLLQISLVESLSTREIEVLQALESELSGPQIADTLFISLNTLRTHMKNIYAKLGVNTRRAALRRAKELGF